MIYLFIWVLLFTFLSSKNVLPNNSHSPKQSSVMKYKKPIFTTQYKYMVKRMRAWVTCMRICKMRLFLSLTSLGWGDDDVLGVWWWWGPLIPGPRLLGGTGRGRLDTGGGANCVLLPIMTSSSPVRRSISFWEELRVLARSFCVLVSDWLVWGETGSVNTQD